MSDDPTKRRIRRARERAVKLIEGVDLRRVPVDCLVACRGSEVRIIRICLRDPRETEIRDLAALSLPPHVSREIWIPRGDDGFSVRIVK